MTRTERIEKLKGAISTLKSEFIGLDKILDEIEVSLYPWYITPELITRPQIISLWGMTGTGKTSVVRRLVKLLDLESKTLFFDCGEGAENKEVIEKIEEYLGDCSGERERCDVDKGDKGLIFVFDEFQYARTLNESHEEVSKPGLRAVWNIIDSGIINLTSNGWDVGDFNEFLEDLEGFVKFNPGIEVEECNIIKEGDVKKILDDLGLLYFDRGVPGFMRPRLGFSKNSIPEEDFKEDSNPYRPLRVIQDRTFRTLRSKLVSRKSIEYFKEVLTSLKNATTLDEIVEILKTQKPFIITPKCLNCSDSLIFILGNLDEAYKDSKDLNPDIDADVFLKSTQRISTSDIKNALKERFRPEQIARFGNNIIKYPSLSKENFEDIINLEVNRICKAFKENFEISVYVDKDLRKLLYFEGVYPVQGVRPVYTTIGSILTPVLSKILTFLEQKENKSEYQVNIGLRGETDFKKEAIKIFVDYSDTLKESITVKLPLGEERNPKKRKTKVISSVHESGHAIVMAYLTGEAPLQIVSVSTDHGGFCITTNNERDGEISTRQDIMNQVCISLAGYEAERLVYGERPEMLLCGSSSDITECWEEFSSEAYKGGYFGDPYSYSYRDNEQSFTGETKGFEDHELVQKMKTEFERLRGITKDILLNNKDLLKRMAESMSETGEMSRDEMLKLIKGNITGTLTESRLEEARHENDYNWYLSKL